MLMDLFLVFVALYATDVKGVELDDLQSECQSLLAHKAVFGKQVVPCEQSAEHHAWLVEHEKIEKAIANFIESDNDIQVGSLEGHASIGNDCLTSILKTKQKVHGLVNDLMMLSSKIRNHELTLETATQNLSNIYEGIAAAKSKYANSKAACDHAENNPSSNIEMYVTAKGSSEVDHCLATALATRNVRMRELSALQGNTVSQISSASQDLLGLEQYLVNMKGRLMSVETNVAYHSESSSACRRNGTVLALASGIHQMLKKMQQLVVFLDACPGRKNFQLKRVMANAMSADASHPDLHHNDVVKDVLSMLQQGDPILTDGQEQLWNEDGAVIAQHSGEKEDEWLEEVLKMQEDEAMEPNEGSSTIQEPSPLLDAGLGGAVTSTYEEATGSDDDGSTEDEIQLIDPTSTFD